MLDDELGQLAGFRSLLRQFQFFSERAAAVRGLTSVQYQALLAIKTQPGDVPLTVKGLAQLLLIKHNSAVGLVNRIEQLGLVVRHHSDSDRRSVVVALTARGKLAMNRLAIEHESELQKLAPEMSPYVLHFAKRVADPAPSKARTRSGA